MKFFSLLPALVVSCLSSCLTFQARPLVPEDTASAFTGRSLTDPGLQRFLAEQKAGQGGWGVDRLALAAAYFQPAVRVARAQAQEASAGLITAGQRPNPQLTFSPQYNVSSRGLSPWILAPQLNVTLETAGKRGKRQAVARAEAEAAELRVAAAAWEARTAVRTAMLELYSARQNGQLLDAEMALHEEALAKLSAQVNAGESPAFEVTQERLALNRTKLARHDVERLAATAREHLATAVGVPPAALDAISLDDSAFTSMPPLAASAAQRWAVTHRSDLLAALADYAAADLTLRLEVAKQYPDLNLQPGYELDQGDHRWGLGVQVELPILNQNRGPIAQAEAKRKTAGLRFEEKQISVFGEIGAATAAYRTALAKVKTAAQLADQSAHACQTTQRMVEVGELAPLELLRRKIEASAATLALLESRLQAQEAAGQLEAAIQRPLYR